MNYVEKALLLRGNRADCKEDRLKTKEAKTMELFEAFRAFDNFPIYDGKAKLMAELGGDRVYLLASKIEGQHEQYREPLFYVRYSSDWFCYRFVQIHPMVDLPDREYGDFKELMDVVALIVSGL
jgi:hypothetical protein